MELSHPVNFQVATIYQTFSYFDFCPHSLLFKIPLSPMTEEINYINPPIQLVFNFYFLFQTLFTSSVQLHPLTNNSFWTFKPNFLFNFFLFFFKNLFSEIITQINFHNRSPKSTFTFSTRSLMQTHPGDSFSTFQVGAKIPCCSLEKGIYPIKKSIVG